MDEAIKLGFKHLVLPRGLLERVGKRSGIKLLPISRIDELPRLVRGGAEAPTRAVSKPRNQRVTKSVEESPIA